MGLIGLFKKKQLPTYKAKITEVDFWNCFFSIEKNKLPDTALLFFKERWAGKAEHGVNWIFIEPNSEPYKIVYNSFHSNDYGHPAVENTTKKEKYIDYDKIENLDMDKIVSIVNETFYLNLSKNDCVDEDVFVNWIIKHKKQIGNKEESKAYTISYNQR